MSWKIVYGWVCDSVSDNCSHLLRRGSKWPNTTAWNVCMHFQPSLPEFLMAWCVCALLVQPSWGGLVKRGNGNLPVISWKTEEDKICKVVFTRRPLKFSECLATGISLGWIDHNTLSAAPAQWDVCGFWLCRSLSPLPKYIINFRLNESSFILQHVMNQNHAMHAFDACSPLGE